MDELIIFVSTALGVCLLLGLFFYFVKPDAIIFGMKAKYIVTMVIIILSSIFVLLMKLRGNRKDDQDLASISRQLRDKKIESDLAVNRHIRQQNEKEISKIDEMIKKVDLSLESNESKVIELKTKRDEIDSKIKDLDVQHNNIKQKSAKQIMDNISKHIGE